MYRGLNNVLYKKTVHLDFDKLGKTNDTLPPNEEMK